MVSTTTIRLPEDLKQRLASAAERLGQSTHSFILAAIAEKAEAEEKRADFDTEADARFEKIIESGQTIPWSEMRTQLLAERAGDKSVERVAKKRR